MKTNRLVHHIAISVNPTKYKQVIEKTFSQTLGLYFFVLAVALLVLFVIGLVDVDGVFFATKGFVSPTIGSSLEPSIILLPGLVLLSGLFLFIASHFLTLLSALLIKASVRKAVSFRDAWILCLHAILVPLLLFTIFLPFAKPFWSAIVMFFFYALFVAIGTSLVAGKELKSAPSSDSYSFTSSKSSKKSSDAKIKKGSKHK